MRAADKLAQTNGDCARMRGEPPKGWNEARIGDRPVTRKAFAWPAPGDECRFVLESRPAVALRCDPKSLDGPHPSAQSNFANDHEVDTADA